VLAHLGGRGCPSMVVMHVRHLVVLPVRTHSQGSGRRSRLRLAAPPLGTPRSRLHRASFVLEPLLVLLVLLLAACLLPSVRTCI
jgi:hypothetical protein